MIKHAAALALAARLCLVPAVASQPNIVLVMADDVGVEAFGCYGGSSYGTPRIDALAAGGMKFEHCYSQPLCTPSRVEIMTGKSNVRNYVDFRVLRPGENTFAHALGGLGYSTAVIGKWQLYGSVNAGNRSYQTGTLPGDAGFDEYCLWQIDQLGSRYGNPLIDQNGTVLTTGAGDYGPDIFAAYADGFIEREHAAGNPFFLYYPMALVHAPFEPTPDSPAGGGTAAENFGDMVRYTDKIVGGIEDKLGELGIREDTLFIFTGDNGTDPSITSTAGGAPAQGGKGLMTDAGTRVPLVVNWPGTTPAGRESDGLIAFPDFFPTLVEAAGGSPAADLDGVSFLPQLRGEHGRPRDSIYMFHQPRLRDDNVTIWIRDQRWKLYDDGRFFDVRNDPLEANPLPAGEARPLGEAARLRLANQLAGMPLVSEVPEVAALKGATRAPDDKPNIVVIFCDDAGYGDFGFTGHPTIKTPNLDRMAREGMWFTQFCSASPACTASRYGLLTGRHPRRSGFGWVLNPGSTKYLHPNEITIAEALKGRGYATAMFGKWHLGYPNANNGNNTGSLPLNHGFDRWLGLPYSNDMLPPKWHDIRLLEGPDSTPGNEIPGYLTVALAPDQSLLTGSYTERALSFIRDSRDGPFLLYMPYAMPHIPLFPGADFAGRSRRGTYGDVIEEIDWSVGRVLQTLREEGIERNTLVVFTSDNGPWITKGDRGGSSGGFRDGKGSTWEGGQREPGLAWWPGTIAPGSVCREPASTLDIMPTAALLAGASVPADRSIDGRDIRPLLLGTGTLPETPFFYGGPSSSAIQAVRKGRWKLHIKTNSQTGSNHGWPNVSNSNPLLFDLHADPGERFNLAADQAAVVTDLKAEITAFNNGISAEGTFWD